MATIPTPRSFSQIVGQMTNSVLSRLGLPSLKVGSPVLSIIEAAAQSDLRNSQDIFNLLSSLSLDNASGIALDRIGQDEGVPRIAQTAAIGSVTISDSRYTKKATLIYQGAGPVLAGSTSFTVEDGSVLGSSGSIYLGRGTINYEGPLAIVSVSGNVVTCAPTTKFHNPGESVILAQGGLRTISTGTTVKTSAGAVSSAVSFTVSATASIPDGEVQIQNVPVLCTLPGVIGNVVANSVVAFSSAPFTGATVTNPTPFSSGRDTESPESYKERIRQAKQSRTKGTSLAVQAGVVGITALDENKRVLSSSLVARQGEPAFLYIDDGTGYEENNEGIAYEILTESAAGGEKYFQLVNGRPVAKAFVKTSLVAPFALVDSCQLSVEVGGTRTVHLFDSAEFGSISNASAYEVAQSINANPNLLWSARVSDNASKVCLFAKDDTNEAIQVVSSDVGAVESNDFLGFSTSLSETLWLYKNDVLLNKDGTVASLVSNPQANWNTIGDGSVLDLSVDGIELSVKINDSDFVNFGTGYSTVNKNNSLQSWVDVLNGKIAGVTCTVVGSTISISSNRGRSSNASVVLDQNSTVAAAMFSEFSAYGEQSDYTLDRNLGHIKLNVALSAGDKLTAGSLATRGFLETPSFTSKVVGAEDTSFAGDSGAELWFGIDGAAENIPVAANPGTSLAIDFSSPKATYTIAGGFTNAAVGDWLMVTDSAVDVANRGCCKITDRHNDWVKVESTGSIAQPTVTLASGGLKVIRCSNPPQRVYIPAGTYSPTTLAAALVVDGATASVYRTSKVRIRTNTFSSGSLALVAANEGGVALGFEMFQTIPSGATHYASMVSGNSQVGTPDFLNHILDTVTPGDRDSFGSVTNHPSSGAILEFLKTQDSSGTRIGNDGLVSTIENRSSNTFNIREKATKQFIASQRFFAASPFAISARDQIGFVVDGDETTKRYVTNMYREVKPTGGTYSASQEFVETNGNPLATAFGASFDWSDFALHMKAREGSSGILWRYHRHGPEGNRARIRYVLPASASTAVGVSTSTRTSDYIDIEVSLASGAARSLPKVRASSSIAKVRVSGAGTTETWRYYFQIPASSGTRSGSTVTLTTSVTHGLSAGDVVWVQSPDLNYLSGPKVLQAPTSGSTLTYFEAGTVVGLIGTAYISKDNAGEVDVSSATALGDIVKFNGVVGKITVVDPAYRSIEFTTRGPATGIVTITWTPNTSGFTIYQLGTNTTAAIASAVSGVVTGTEITPGSVLDSTDFVSLTDGVNFIKDSSGGTFNFKDAVASGLGDWANELVRLVPITAANVANFLDSQASGGLFQTTEISVSNSAQRPQVTTDTIGSLGSIEVSGGSANTLATSVIGSAVANTNTATVAVSSSSVEGLCGDTWVAFDNSVPAPKSAISDSTTATLGGSGSVALDSLAWEKISGQSLTWQIEKQGKFTAFVCEGSPTAFGTVQEGDWAIVDPNSIDPTVSITGTVSASNKGIFRVVRTTTSPDTFWIENDKTVEEVATATVWFLKANSILPGDTVSVGSTSWGANNLGTWTVDRLDSGGENIFFLDESEKTLTPWSAANSNLVRVYSNRLGRSIKKILGIGPATSGILDVKFESEKAISGISASYGTVMSSLDKLNFGSSDNTVATVVPGLDGYSHSVGLISEANRVVYGDEEQSSTYPGIAAAGAKININGPLIRNVAISVVLRTKTGINLADVEDKARSAIVGKINSTNIGQHIAISDLISAAQSVNGVVAVSVQSPVYGLGNDIIETQPYEKPLVINPKNDIQISFVGA